MSENYFEVPPVTERNLMTHIAPLFTGESGTADLFHASALRVEVRERMTVRFKGELAAWDGPTVPLGLVVDGPLDVWILDLMSHGEARGGVTTEPVRLPSCCRGPSLWVGCPLAG